MIRALELARRGEGKTSPNPMVGAVVTRDDEVLGEGYHLRAGGPHAEVEALRAAGNRAQGATLFVTLEPCAHHGRTPPCTDALIEAGVREVYFAVGDPDPRVNGRGRAALESAGIMVREGMCEAEARRLNRAYFKRVRTGQPLVTLKYAMSLDGRIATRTGDSRWISNELSRLRVHELRAMSDAILVGAGTMLADDPSLTARLGADQEHGQPTRYILDSKGRVPATMRAFDPALPGEAVLVTTSATPGSHRDAVAARGVEVLEMPALPSGRVDLSSLLQELGKRGALNLLVEGGAEVIGSFLDGELADRVWVFVAPIILGGESAPAPVGGAGVARVADAIRLINVETEMLESDMWIRGDIEINKAEDG